MKLDEIIEKSKEAQNILNKAKELDNRIHNILSNIKEIDIDKAESLIKSYERTTNYAEGILTLLPLKEKSEEEKKRKSMKDYPDEKRFQIYQNLLSLYFEDKNQIIETHKIAKKFKISNKVAGTYLQHNEKLESIGLNKRKFKKDFLDKTLKYIVNMLLAEKPYFTSKDINKEHAISVGMALARRYKDVGLERKTAIGGIYKYFRK